VVADFDAVLSLPCAAVGIRVHAGAIVEITFLPLDTPGRPPSGGLAARACEQIQAYADDPARRIDLPLAIEGSEFQRRVWAAIARIPSGATRTYGDLLKSSAARRVRSDRRAEITVCRSPSRAIGLSRPAAWVVSRTAPTA
jgi:methylated-DNA-[protein]-cysteine S-methyltransferase